MILQIERLWNRDPGWFYTLPKYQQIMLIADFRMDCETPKRTQIQHKAANRARLDKMKQKAQKTGAVKDGG